jgi:hypothetical protein
MKRLGWLLTALFTASAHAQTYTLVPENHCSNSLDKAEFTCRPGPSSTAIAKFQVFRKAGGWHGRELIQTLSGLKANEFALPLLRADANAVSLTYPVLWSGSATIVLILKSGRYYFSEISYSEALDTSNVTIERGRFTIER